MALARGEQFFHITARKQALFTEKLGDEGDARVMLDDVHAMEGGDEIGAEGDHAVIGHEDRVVIRNEWFERPGKFGCAGQSKRREWNSTKGDDHFREQRLIERNASGSETCGDGWMRVANRVGIQAAIYN